MPLIVYCPECGAAVDVPKGGVQVLGCPSGHAFDLQSSVNARRAEFLQLKQRVEVLETALFAAKETSV